MHTHPKFLYRVASPNARVFLVLILLSAVFVIGSISFAKLEEQRPPAPEPVQQSSSTAPQQSPVSRPVPWYRTPWALATYGLGVAGAIVFFVRRRTAVLAKRHESLEQVVAQRTEKVREQKQTLETYNRELLRTNQTLRRTVEEKSKLLGMAAHDLKNPLFGIRALSEIVLEADDLPSKHHRKLNLIRESADETLHLIDDLLASAAGSTQSELNEEDVDVAALVQWVVRSFEPQAQRKEQPLQCSVAEAPCTVQGDKRKLREAIGNLISNALKYSPPGQEINVIVEREQQTVQVAVVDTGPGLSESDQQRMFAPFQRLSAEPTGDEGSSGLGLYIVKKIADLHDGTIEVETVPGEGSTFALVLPATPPDASPVPETNPTDVEVEMQSSNA
mgnify:CR=1 FL=1